MLRVGIYTAYLCYKVLCILIYHERDTCDSIEYHELEDHVLTTCRRR